MIFDLNSESFNKLIVEAKKESSEASKDEKKDSQMKPDLIFKKQKTRFTNIIVKAKKYIKGNS